MSGRHTGNRGADSADMDPTREATMARVVWVVFDPVYQEYAMSDPLNGWSATKARSHAHEFADDVTAERIRQLHFAHRASMAVARTTAYYTV